MTTTNQQPDWAFIINPVAGAGIALEVEKELQKQLKQRDIAAEIVFTARKGHASELAKELANSNYKYIVAVGGDGTFNEMASELVKHPQCTMGHIPAGTGNDFAQIIGLPAKFDDSYWDIFFEAKTHKLDVGRCNGKLFFNGMGLGFDAQVAAENYSPTGEVKQGGKGKYIWHILKNLLFFKEQKMQITTDNQNTTELCFMQTVAIGRRFAGDFFITPEAYADDNLLDVCLVKKLNLFQRLSILLKVPKGTHITNPNVHYYKTPELIVETDKKVPFHLDGELFFDTRFEIDILQEKPSIIFNSSGNNFFSKAK